MDLKRYLPTGTWCPPEGAAAAGAICGIAVWQIPWIAFFLPLGWIISRDRKWIFACFAAMTALSVWLQGTPVAEPAPKSGKWVRAVCRVTDTGLSRLPDIPRPGMVTAELQNVFGADGEELDVSGRVMIRLPEEFREKLLAGDLLEGEGILSQPHGSFARYTAARRIKWVFIPDECRLTGAVSGSWLRKIAEAREFLLQRAVKHLSSAERRMMAASLFFGIRGGISGPERQKMIHAGVIHLYSVSGLHVGIIAGVLMLFLRGVPGRWKYGVLIPATLLYVVSAGANVPALRAWIMISVWAACRMFLYWMPVRRVLGYAAAGMLIWQPAWLYDMGFLYSFEITLILLLLGQNLQKIRKHLNDPAWMMPRNPGRDRMYRILRMRNLFWCAVFACMAALLGGAATGLIFQGRFLPASVMANLLLMPIVAFLFPVMALKIAAGWICGVLDRLLAWCIDFAWNLMDGVIALAQFSEATVTGCPPLWSAILFFAALILCFTPEISRKMRISGGVLCAVLLIFWHGSMLFRPPSGMIVHGNFAEVPAVALADTRSGVGIVINVPDGASAAVMAEFFLAHGISTVDRVLVSSARSGNIRGLKTLMQRIRVRQIVLPEMDRYSGGFRKKMQEHLADMPELRSTDRPGNVKIQESENQWSVEYDNPAGGIRCRIVFDPETITVNGSCMPFLRTSETVKQVFRL